VLHLADSGHASAWAKLHGGVLLGVPLGTGLCGPGTCDGLPLALGALYPLLLILALGARVGCSRWVLALGARVGCATDGN